MSLQFNLDKSTQALQFKLQKRSVATINPLQVTFVHDVSGSFDDEHRDGYTQKLLNRFVPFANLFDKNKTMESFAFSSSATQLTDVTVNNYSDYVSKHVIGCSGYGRGTAYHTAIELIVNSLKQESSSVTSGGFLGGLFGKKKEVQSTEQEKYLHFFLTDGESQTETQDLRTINDLLGREGNHFIVFLSVAPRKLYFLETNYSNHKYTDYHNFTKQQLQNIDQLTDDELYDMLLSPQLIEWMNS